MKFTELFFPLYQLLLVISFPSVKAQYFDLFTARFGYIGICPHFSFLVLLQEKA